MSGEEVWGCSRHSGSSQRCSEGLRSGLCTGHGTFFTPILPVMPDQVWSLFSSSEVKFVILQHAKAFYTIVCVYNFLLRTTCRCVGQVSIYF